MKETQGISKFSLIYLIEHSPWFQVTEKSKAICKSLLLEDIACYILGVGTTERFHTLM